MKRSRGHRLQTAIDRHGVVVEASAQAIPQLRVDRVGRCSGVYEEGAFADALMEYDQSGNGDLQAKIALVQYWNQQADDALQAEVDQLVIQGQKLQYNFGRCRTYSREVESCAFVTITDT